MRWLYGSEGKVSFRGGFSRRALSYAILSVFARAFGLRAGTQSAPVEEFQPMCGIAGMFRYGSDRPIETTVLREMVSRMRHRGPDDEGTVVAGRTGLAHTRLSIIDLSPLG